MPDAAATFRQLHHGPQLLRLANCWDAGSARLIAHLGARAIATTSAGVAWSHGYPDGDVLPTERLVATVGAIARVVDVPISVDGEGGYSDDSAAVAETGAALVHPSARGVKVEGRAGPPGPPPAQIPHAK